MQIHVLPADVGGCGRYRLIWPGKAVRANAQGVDVTVYDPNSDDSNLQAICYKDGEGVEHVWAANRDADVVILQRPLKRLLADIIPHFQQRGIKVIVEIDDDFHAISPRNAAWRTMQDKDKNQHHLMRACQQADRVTCSTPALLRRYGCGHGVLLPNYVPAWYLTVDKQWHEPNRIGWSGTVATHPDDLQVMGAGLAEAARQGNDIYIVGTAVGVAPRTGLSPQQTIHASGWVEIEDYPWQMAEVDVGIVPLEDTAFNQAKSWLKGLEFAALGVPFVASPTQPYQQLLDDYGIGVLEGSRKKWGKALQWVTDNREGLGELFRQRVDKHDLIIERQWEQWLKAWTEW